MRTSEKISNHIFKLTKILENRLDFICPLFLVLLSLIFISPVFSGKIPLPVDALVGAHTPWTEVKWEGYPAGIPIKNQEITDAISQFYPWRSFAGNSLRKGELPLWNPYMFSGAPFLASLHSAAVYPLNLIYLFLSDKNSWTMLIYLQILLAGIFTYLLLLSAGLREPSALFGGIIFAYSGYMIAWLEFATGGHAGLWLPLLLLLELKLIKTGKIIYIPLLAPIFFLINTAGDFQVPLYITFTYFSLSVFLLLTDKNKKLFSVDLLKIIAAWILGLLVSSIQLLPTLELFFRSIRQNDPYIAEYNFGLMDYSKTLNFIWPDFFGNIVTRNYWGRFGFHEYMAFAGILSLVFLIYSLFKTKTSTEKYFWLLLLFSLIMLFPNPVSKLPYIFNLPGLGTSSASRIIFLTDFCIAVIASFGFNKWLTAKDHEGLKKIVLFFLAASAVTAAGITFYILLGSKGMVLYDQTLISNLKIALRNMVPGSFVLSAVFILLKIVGSKNIFPKGPWAVLIPSFMIISLLSLEMLYFASKNTPFAPGKFLFPQTETLKFLEKNTGYSRIAGPGLPLNYFMAYGIRSSEGYDSLYPEMNASWFSLVNSSDTKHLSGRYGEIYNFNSPLLKYAAVKYVIDYRKNIFNKMPDKEGQYMDGLKAPEFRNVFSEGRVSVFENTKVLPKVWAGNKFIVQPDEQKYLDEVNSLRDDKKIVLNSEPSGINFSPQDGDLQIRDYKEEINRISLNTFNTRDSLLFISESYSDGWKATVDNKSTPVYRANLLFMAISLPGGEHSVRLVYKPMSFIYGGYITLFGFSAAAIILYMKRQELKSVKFKPTVKR